MLIAVILELAGGIFILANGTESSNLKPWLTNTFNKLIIDSNYNPQANYLLQMVQEKVWKSFVVTRCPRLMLTPAFMANLSMLLSFASVPWEYCVSRECFELENETFPWCSTTSVASIPFTLWISFSVFCTLVYVLRGSSGGCAAESSVEICKCF